MSKNILITTIAAADENHDAGGAEKILRKNNINDNSKETTNRAALGNIENRAVGRSISTNNKETNVASKEGCRTKFQNVKPKVDSYWKKSSETVTGGEVTSTASTTTTTKSTNATKISEQTGVVAIQQKKVLTRSNSVRVISSKGSTNVQSKGNEGKFGIEKTTKTFTTTKVIEKKLPKLKGVTSNATTTTNIAIGAKKSNTNANAVDLDEKPIITGHNNKNVVHHEKGRNELPQKEAIANDKPNAGEKLQSSVSALIRDIDDGCDNNMILVTEYVNDIYSYLYDLEEKNSVIKNNMKDQLEINGKMRAVLIDWISEVSHQFHLLLETFQLSVTIMDRFLDVVKNTKRSELQLVGATALFLATKYEELYPPSSNDFAYITDNAYTAKQICQMEIKILKAIQFDLSWPLPIHFLRRFSKAAGAENCHHNMAKYFMELITTKSDMTQYKPSELAAASLFLSLNLLKNNHKLPSGFNDEYWTPTLQHYTRYNVNHLKPICRKMAIVVRDAPIAKLQAVYIKYQSTKFEKVSTRPELYGALMDSIIGPDNNTKSTK